MPKTAQQKFSEYLFECQETRDAMGAFEKAVQDRYEGHGYAYIAGYLMTQLQSAVSELPKARRAEFRANMLREAKRFEQETLLRKIKESA